MKHGLFGGYGAMTNDGINIPDLRELGMVNPYKIGVDLAKEPEKSEEPDEWIWVIGYKGTDKNMRCRDTQFAFGTQFDIVAADEDIEECRCGYHLCLKLRDVFDHYGIGKGNRFFEVKALVRKRDVEKYPVIQVRNKFTGTMLGGFTPKIVSKSIEFVRECTLEEIFKDTIAAEWSETHKKIALITSIADARKTLVAEELTQYGYSLPFAQYIVDHGKYETAKVVGSQTDLSMDMKALLIFK